MPANRVSASVSAAERQDVMNAIVTISQSLSCLIDLGTEERRGMSSWAIAIERLPAKRLFEALQPMLLALTRLR